MKCFYQRVFVTLGLLLCYALPNSWATTTYTIVNSYSSYSSCGSTTVNCTGYPYYCAPGSQTAHTYVGGVIKISSAYISGNQLNLIIRKCDGTAFSSNYLLYGLRENTCACSNSSNIGGGSKSVLNQTSFTAQGTFPASFTSGIRDYYLMIETHPSGNHYRTVRIRVQATTTSSCNAPSSLYNASNVTTTSAYLDWSYVSGSSYYQVRYRPSSGGSYSYATSTSSAKSVTGLSSGTCYDWWVRTRCGTTWSSWSSSRNFCTNNPPCNAPSSLYNASNITTTSAYLDWSYVSGSSYYQVRYRPSSGGSYSYATSTSSVKSVTGLSSGTCYDWWVRTRCGTTWSNWSSSRNFCTNTPPCNAPSSLYNASNITTTSANLDWSNVSGASFYHIRYRPSSGGSYSYATSTNSARAVTGLSSGTCYDWWVRTRCGTTWSSWSSSRNFCTNTPPCNAPSSLYNASNITTTSANLDWSNVSGASFYHIRYRPSSGGSYSYATSTNSARTMTGLSSGTCYDWWVRTRCGNTWSNWSSSRNFCTTSNTTPLAITGVAVSPSVGYVNTTNFNFSCQVSGGNGTPITVVVDFLDYNGTPFPMSGTGGTGQYTKTKSLSGIGMQRGFQYVATQGGIIVKSPVFYVDVIPDCNNITALESEIISRQVWCEDNVCRNRVPAGYDNNNIDRIVIHHSVASNSTTNWSHKLYNDYSYHKGLGWHDLGYHYAIDPNGNIYEGRAGTESKRGVHTGGNSGNWKSVGIVLMGNYTNIAPSQQMLESLNRLLVYLCSKYNIDPKGTVTLASYKVPSNNSIVHNNYSVPTIEGHRVYGVGVKGCTSCVGPTACPGNTFYPMMQTDVIDKVSECINNNFPNYSLRTVRLLGSIVKSGKIIRVSNGIRKYVGQTDRNGFGRCRFYPELQVGDTLEIEAEGYTPIQIITDATMAANQNINIPLFVDVANSTALRNPYVNVIGRNTVTLDTFVTVEVGGENVQSFEYLHDTTWIAVPSTVFTYPLFSSYLEEQGEEMMRAINIRAIGNGDTTYLHQELLWLDTTIQTFNTLTLATITDDVWVYVDGVFDSKLNTGNHTLLLPKHATTLTFYAQGYHQQDVVVELDTAFTVNLQSKATMFINTVIDFSTDSIQFAGQDIAIKQKLTPTALQLNVVPNNQLYALSPNMIQFSRPNGNPFMAKIDAIWYLDDTVTYAQQNYEVFIEQNGTVNFISPANFGDSIVFDSINKVLKVFGLDGNETIGIVHNISPIHLPVELTEFNVYKAHEGERKALVKWSTASEINCAKYEIQHATDAVNFKTVGQVICMGGEQVSYDYTYIDQAVVGDNYYRLQQIDHDGSFEYSPVRHVHFKGFGTEFTLYPNPNQGDFTIEFGTAMQENYTVRIFNTLGKQVVAGLIVKTAQLCKINMATMANGVYWIEITKDGQRWLERVEIMK